MPDDIVAFRRHLNGGTGINTTKIAATLATLAVSILLLSFFFRSLIRTPGTRTPSGVFSSSLLIYVALTVFFFVLVTLLRRTSFGIDRKSPILQHRSEATLLPDAFSISFGAQTNATRWDGIEKIETTPAHLFVFTMPQDGFIIPRHAFDSDESFAQFADYARHKWSEARPQTPPIARV